MNAGAKIVNNVIGNSIQQHTERIMHHNQWDLSLGHKDGFAYANL
jgi:hypothetical protein